MSLQVGGAIRSGALYVERAVDHQLLQHTLAGELCYILASRQIGKSSLRAHAALALHAAGCRVASVDLSMFGTVDLSAESFFLGVLTEIGADLGEDVDALWADHHRLPPAARWQRCLQALSVDRDCALVVFLDEIDGMRRIPQLGADLFATIRAATDRAALDARWKKLTFVLLGAATPAELIQDPLRTPFNVGRALEITDFTATEARALLPFLEELRPGSAPDLLQQILAWTSGHPYQTARVAAFLAEHPGLTVDDAISRLGAAKDGSLEAAAALLRATPALLLAYRQVLAGQALPHDPLLPELLLTGLVAIRDGVVCPRNRITTTLYGAPWVASQLGRRQLRTQTDVWIAGGRKRQHLPDAATLARLQQTLTSQENLERDEQEFLLVATEELRNRRLRRFVAALAVFVVVALVVAGLQWDRAEAERRERDRTRAELGLLEEARQAGQEVDRALLPGEQILALERVLNAQARLQGTPLENLATHDLAEVLEYSHGPRLGNALPTWRVMSRPDGSFLLGRSNLEETRGSLELRSSGGDLLEEVPLESAVSALARHGGLVWAGTRDGLLYTWDGTHLQQRRSPHRSEPVAYCYNYWPPAPRGSSRVGKPRTSPAVQQVAAIEGWALSRGSEGEVWLWPAGEGPGVFLSKDTIGATFSPDGSRVAVAHRDGRLSVYRRADQALLWTRGPWPRPHRDPHDCDDQKLLPDTLLTVTSARDGLVVTGRAGLVLQIRWDGSDERILDVGTQAVTRAAVSPDGSLLVLAEESGRITTWRDGQRLYERREHRQAINGLTFSPDGALLASVGHDDAVRLWDPQSGELLWSSFVASGSGMDLAFSADGARLLVGAGQGAWLLSTGPGMALRQWRIPGRGRPTLLSEGHSAPAVSWTDGAPTPLDSSRPPAGDSNLHYNPDRRRAVWTSNNNEAWIEDGDHRYGPLQGRAAFLVSPWSPDGERLLLVSPSGQDRLWRAALWSARGEKLGELPKAVAPYVHWSADGERLLASGISGDIAWYNGRNGAWEEDLEPGLFRGEHRELYHADEGPDGALAFALLDQTAWMKRDGRWQQLQSAPAAFLTVFAGSRLWVGQRGGRIGIFDDRPEPVLDFAAHQGATRVIRRSPDGQRVVTGGEDGFVRLWTAGGQLIAAIPAHSAVVRQTIFTHDGEGIFSAGDNGTVVELPGSPAAIRALACRWLELAGRPCSG